MLLTHFGVNITPKCGVMFDKSDKSSLSDLARIFYIDQVEHNINNNLKDSNIINTVCIVLLLLVLPTGRIHYMMKIKLTLSNSLKALCRCARDQYPHTYAINLSPQRSTGEPIQQYCLWFHQTWHNTLWKGATNVSPLSSLKHAGAIVNGSYELSFHRADYEGESYWINMMFIL